MAAHQVPHVMPSDVTGDEIGAPQLCRDHVPVIENLRHLDDIDHTAVTNATAEYIRQCCQTRGATT